MSINYKDHIRTIEDFPEPGIHFYDIAPLLGSGAVFASAIHDMTEPLEVRKAGKLPGETVGIEYELEYGKNKVELQSDALSDQDRVVLVDDVIATGGTAVAGIELARRTGASVIEFCSLVDLRFLGGSERIRSTDTPVRSIISYDQ